MGPHVFLVVAPELSFQLRPRFAAGRQSAKATNGMYGQNVVQTGSRQGSTGLRLARTVESPWLHQSADLRFRLQVLRAA